MSEKKREKNNRRWFYVGIAHGHSLRSHNSWKLQLYIYIFFYFPRESSSLSKSRGAQANDLDNRPWYFQSNVIVGHDATRGDGPGDRSTHYNFRSRRAANEREREAYIIAGVERGREKKREKDWEKENQQQRRIAREREAERDNTRTRRRAERREKEKRRGERGRERKRDQEATRGTASENAQQIATSS